MLTDRIYLAGHESEEPEDFLSESLGVIFNDITNQHGDATSSVIYKSDKFGPINLELANPKDENTSLFSHFLWNAGLQLAAFIEAGVDDFGREWDVRGQKVMELGAGTGLAGIISILSGAEETVISDYPTPEVLSNIVANIKENIPTELLARSKVQGHSWGILSDEFSVEHQGTFTRMLGESTSCFERDLIEKL